MPFDAATILNQLDEVLRQGAKAGGGRTGYLEAIGLYCSVITRLSSPSSSHVALMKEICAQPLQDRAGAGDEQRRSDKLLGIVKALRADYAGGRTQSFQELVHADLFSDFLEMAEHLLQGCYKDAAAVLAGGVLEEHLRKLCGKFSVTLTPRPKIDSMNSELAKKAAYGLNEQKLVTAWAGIRNDAAHRKYENYALEQVSLMITGIRDFIARNPA